MVLILNEPGDCLDLCYRKVREANSVGIIYTSDDTIVGRANRLPASIVDGFIDFNAYIRLVTLTINHVVLLQPEQ